MRPRGAELPPLLAAWDDDDEPRDALCSLSCWMSFKESDRPVPSYLQGRGKPSEIGFKYLKGMWRWGDQDWVFKSFVMLVL